MEWQIGHKHRLFPEPNMSYWKCNWVFWPCHCHFLKKLPQALHRWKNPKK